MSLTRVQLQGKYKVQITSALVKGNNKEELSIFQYLYRSIDNIKYIVNFKNEDHMILNLTESPFLKNNRDTSFTWRKMTFTFTNGIKDSIETNNSKLVFTKFYSR